MKSVLSIRRGEENLRTIQLQGWGCLHHLDGSAACSQPPCPQGLLGLDDRSELLQHRRWGGVGGREHGSALPCVHSPCWHQRGFSYHPPPTPSSGVVRFLLSGASRGLTALQAFTGSVCLLPSPPPCHGRPWPCSEAAVGWLATRRKEGSCFSTFIPKYQCDRLNVGLPKHIHFHFINNLKCQCTGLSDCVTQIVGLDLIIGRSRDVICKGETQEYARTPSSLLKAWPQT